MERDDVIQILRSARVPERYCKPELSLDGEGESGAKVKVWLRAKGYRELRKGGHVVEIVGSKTKAIRIFYLLLRASVLKLVPLRLYTASDIVYGWAEFLEDITERGVRCVAVMGAVVKDPNQFNVEDRHRLATVFCNLVDRGLSLVLLNERSFLEAEEFPELYRETIREVVTQQFDI